MEISASLLNDVWHDLKEPGSYEWWYFDAADTSETYSFVAIWYSGFPFSPYYLKRYKNWKEGREPFPTPLEHAAFSFNLYESGDEVVNFIKEGDSHLFEASSSRPFARFEKNEFEYDELHQRFVLKVDFDMPSRKKKVKGEIYFNIDFPESEFEFAPMHTLGGTHSWILVAPKALVTGQFEVLDGVKKKTETIQFNGNGYHDHNFGRVPMSADIDNWYWGRAHSKNYDLVYYIISYKDREPFSFLRLTENDKLIRLESNTMKVEEHEKESNRFQPSYSKLITMSNDDLRFSIDHLKALDRGPFYLRFQSEFILNLHGEEFKMTGISEFLHPDRINSGLVQNLIKSKIWRDGRSSKMYTLYNFFNRMIE